MSLVKFEYHPTIKKIYWTLIALSILALLIIFRVNILKWSAETYIGTVIKMVMTSLVPLSVIIRLHFFIRPLIFSKYQLEDNILKIKFKRKEKIIDLNKVKSLSFTLFSPRFFGGCKIKTQSGDEIRFLSLLQNNQKIVEYLAKNKPDLKPEKKYNRYIQTTKLVGLSWKRIVNRLKNWPYLWFKFLIIPLGFVFYLRSQVDFGSSVGISAIERIAFISLIFLAVNFLVSFFYNHFEEMILNNQALENSTEEFNAWDFKKEKTIFMITQIIYIISTSMVLYFLARVFMHFLGEQL